MSQECLVTWVEFTISILKWKSNLHLFVLIVSVKRLLSFVWGE